MISKAIQITGAVLLTLLMATAHAGTVAVTDDDGRQLTLPGPAKRIVSLAPHITELLFAAGAGDRIVGTVEYSDYPEPAKQIERIGNHSAIDMERLAALQPDLIIAWQSGNPKQALKKLEQMGYTLFYSEPRTIDDIASTMIRFATIAGTRAVAAKEVKQFRHQYEQLKVEYAGKAAVTVFYEIWNQPMMTVNGQHLISEVIRLCGGQNVFADLDKLAPNVGIEPVLAADPDVIIASSNDGKAPDWLFDWKRWPDLGAVRYGNLFYVNWNHINRHSPRILKGVRDVCELLETARKNMR
jgi:iron complex transport system substrate-binding protein